MVDNYQSIGSNPNREIFLKAAMNSNSNNNSSERLLPIANIGRIMKQILPSNAKVSKEAKETMQECVSEFISFVTVEAADKCHKEKRKTVNGDDVCWAMGSLGFDDFVDPLRRYLVRYREQEGENNNQLPNGYEEDSTNGTDGKTSSPSSIPFQFMSFMDSSYKRV